ncbi:outer membrane protein assembly factor BamE [Variovorax ginsengisoli]|uniref:Outer membrane protein assembly factor BamE n=1 Tax=Variovorax guangxiensis TaxID=1775474 RepID=A0A502DE00_9BURK|nr:outer membrane protein assembly factor BamE [Variovorax ginsengisoli]TPG23887.1 outer membrane protein assembly factor BamE [Variovorax guangxiensis]
MGRQGHETGQRLCARVAELLAFCCVGALAGCVTHRSDDFGERPVFPSAQNATRPEGSFPNRDFLAQVEPGLRKSHLLQWFGPPHFGEGLLGVREWDYIFHFHSGGGITTCRYKVVFDRAYVAQSFHWQPKVCGDWLTVKVPAQARGQAAP